MISLLLAAALSAATPATPTPPAPVSQSERLHNLAQDAPLVCAAHLEEEMKIDGAGLKDHQPVVIDIYAAKAGLLPEEKMLLSSYCSMFDLGAGFIVQLSKQQADDGLHRPTLDSPGKHIASF